MERTRICLFAKPPRPGTSKTRLAPAVGPGGAAALADAFLRDTLATVEALPWANVAVTTPDPQGLAALGGRLDVWRQGGGDLGARMERAFRRGLEHSEAVIAIGADSPGLPRERLERAREALARADAVVVPTEDGGFCLLGLTRCEPGLLAELPWSRPTTCGAMLARLRVRGFRPVVLDPWFDIDRPADLHRMRALLSAGQVRAPATAALLLPAVSIVVPVLDEEARIQQTLGALCGEGAWHEVIVVDGGSRDRTVELARDFPVRTLSAPRGRARQMNAGAAAATGSVLLFLHADVELPADALAHVSTALADPCVVAGAFRTWTVADTDRRPWFAPLLHLADLRSRYTRLPYGDQAMFVHAAAFHAVGGFRPLALMEDLDLSQRLRREGRIRTVAARVRVSGRRFVAHPLADTAAVNLFPLLYRMGVSADTLARLYRNIR